MSKIERFRGLRVAFIPEAIFDPRSSIFIPPSSILGDLFILKGDASDSCDEPVETERLMGKVVAVERDGRIIDLASRRAKMLHAARLAAARLKGWISLGVRPIRRPSIRKVVRWNRQST